MVVTLSFLTIMALALSLFLWPKFEVSNSTNFKVIALSYAVVALLASGYLYWPHFVNLTTPKPQWTKRNNPASQTDLDILLRADELLQEEANWDQKNERHCLIWAKNNLFCALALAQREVIGEYDHHGIPTQEIRFTILDQYPQRWSRHPIMDFNNHPDTSFVEIKKVLADTINTLKVRLITKD